MSAAEVSEIPDLFRAVNERIRELGVPALGVADLICECADGECTRVMPMTLGEYDSVRSDPSLRAVLPGHDRVELGGQVVWRTERFVVVRPRDAPLWDKAE